MEQLCWGWAAVVGGRGVLFVCREEGWSDGRQQIATNERSEDKHHFFCVRIAHKGLPIFSGCLLFQMYSPNHSRA